MKKILLVLMMVIVAFSAVAVQDDAILYRGAGSWFGNYSVPDGFGADATVDTTLTGFGLAGATPLVGDINGDGIGDVVVVQVAGGGYQWVAAHSVNDGSGKGLLSSETTSAVNPFGTVEGNEGNMLADINGDGIQDIVTINSGFNWYAVPSGAAGINVGTLQGPAQFGLAGQDQPIIGDFDGDGNADQGIYRIASGGIYWKSSTGGVLGAGTAGPVGQIGAGATDSLIICNLNGDAYADAVMVRQTGADLIQWYGLINTTNASGAYGFLDFFNPGTTIVNFGLDGTDTPMLGDINGDGMDDLVVNRGGTAFYAAFTTAGGALGSTTDDTLILGLAGDIPVLGSIKLVPEPGIIGLLSLFGLAFLRRK